MRLKIFAAVLMAFLGSFAWAKYHPPLRALTPSPVSKVHATPDIGRLSPLPAMTSQEVQTLINQGLVYGLSLDHGQSVALFLARTPDKPSHLEIRHWPPLRFAAVTVLSHPQSTLGVQWTAEQAHIHWLRLSPHWTSKQ